MDAEETKVEEVELDENGMPVKKEEVSSEEAAPAEEAEAPAEM